jgi:hypothetical protein
LFILYPIIFISVLIAVGSITLISSDIVIFQS